MNKTKSLILSIGTTQLIYINKNNYLGKKRESNYDTFSDNYFKKVRTLLIKAIIIFINELVKKITMKQLVDINKTEMTNSSVEYDKEFLYKKLKEILSCISKKYTNVLAIKR